MNKEFRTIELREHEKSNPEVLSLLEYHDLKSALPKATIEFAGGSSGEYYINPHSYVGRIRAGKLIVNIKPKLPIDRVMFLVAYSLAGAQWKDLTVDFANANNLHEAIAFPFAKFAEKATRRHVLQSYQKQQEAINGIKGTLRIADQLRRHMRISPPLEVSYDHLSTDTIENRLLLAASLKLLRLQQLDVKTTRTLNRLIHRLPDVARVSFSKQRIPKIPITRLNNQYEKALALATLILSDRTIEQGSGDSQSPGVLLDMAKIFEDFVHSALMDSLKLNNFSFPKAEKTKLYLDNDQVLRLKPDFSWWEGQNCEAIGDIKYKKSISDNKKGEWSDIYQLLAYTTATDLREGFLIYADTEENPTPHSHNIMHAHKDLHVETLNLSGDPSKILQRVIQIAEKIKTAKNKAKVELELVS